MRTFSMTIVVTAVIPFAAIGIDVMPELIYPLPTKVVHSDVVFVGTVTERKTIREYIHDGTQTRVPENVSELGAVQTTFRIHKWLKGKDLLRDSEKVVQKDAGENRNKLYSVVEYVGHIRTDIGLIENFRPSNLLLGNQYVVMLEKGGHYLVPERFRLSSTDGSFRLTATSSEEFLDALRKIKEWRNIFDTLLKDVDVIKALDDHEVQKITPEGLWLVDSHYSPRKLGNDPRDKPEAWIEWWNKHRHKLVLEEITEAELKKLLDRVNERPNRQLNE